ncbi:12758_t:CDS:10 [Funneliformis caledonium]|uniref:12758_t:CDS:1 n=1 Tax=Funneliformis caledonium TaxID=1117310 RepID=A0A9N8VB52_9GLOM|nr:12758_t:CDS:10 [Funneliformis caledonium]
MDPNSSEKDFMLAQLLSLGFDEWVCRKAVDCNRTVEAATEWILNALDPNSGISRSIPTLSLGSSFDPMTSNNSMSGPVSQSTPQPTIISRHLQPADDSEYTKESKAKAAKAAEEVKKQKILEREARKKALLAIKEDREKIKQRKMSHQARESENIVIGTNNPAASTSSQPGTSSVPTQDTTLIRIRLSTGRSIRQAFATSVRISNLFEWVTNESEPSKEFQLMSQYPRKVFGDDQMDLTLADAGLVPNASLNVVRCDIPSVVVSQQPMPQNVPPSSQTPNVPPGIRPTLPPQIPMQPAIPNNNAPPHFPGGQHTQPSNNPPNVPPHFPVARPTLPPQIPNIPPNFPGGPMQVPRHMQLLGRLPQRPFFGGGHRLTDDLQQNSDGSDDSDDETVNDEEKRKRIADAIQARAKPEENNVEDENVKHGIKHEVGSLRSKCAYTVAALLTSATSFRIINSLANVSSNIGELLVAELIKMEKLDVLTFKRFANCNLQNIILDNYPRASDSLLEVIGSTQRTSVTKVSLRACQVLTDTGLRGLQGLRYLETLDVSSCRVRDRALQFIQEFNNLVDLNLSQTKVTMTGLRDLFANCRFASKLEVLDLSYCAGVCGKTVFADLQPLESIRSLNLCSTQLTPPQVPVNPSSFQKLEILNISSTKLCDQDVMKILCGFKNLVDLNLTKTTGVGQFGLKWMAKEYKSLNEINFPNQEEEMDDILQDFSGLPLDKLNLENFKNVTDVGVMHIGRIKSLSFLSLSGTKLTDAGMTALKDLENLAELYLDRTNITDVDIRGLTHLSLNKTKIKNESLRIIGKAAFSNRGLKYLNVGYTHVTDKGVRELQGLVKLMLLNLEYTEVSLSCRQILAGLPLLQHVRLIGITKEFCDDDS